MHSNSLLNSKGGHVVAFVFDRYILERQAGRSHRTQILSDDLIELVSLTPLQTSITANLEKNPLPFLRPIRPAEHSDPVSKALYRPARLSSA